MKHGFTLVEVLCAMAVASILTLLALSAFQHSVVGTTTGRAGRLLVDQLSLARQEAVGRNRPVEVRFISSSQKPVGYHAVQLWVPRRKDTTEWEPLGPIVTLPDGIAICEKPALSPLIAYAPIPETKLPTSENENLSYCGFRFLPGGGTDIPQNSKNDFVTVALESSAQADEPPADFSAIQIDTLNGQVRLFRP